MSKNFQTVIRTFFSIAFIIITIGSVVIVAQDNVLTGTWKANDNGWISKRADRDKKVVRDNDDDDDDTFNIAEQSKDKVQLNFSFDREKGRSNNFGSGFDYSELRGLTKAQVESANSSVNFSISREAGTIDMQGTFQNGKGSGTFRFTPNRSFASAMQTRGFAFTNEKLFTAAALDLTTAFVDDLLTANFKGLDTDDLFKAKIFKITPQFMSEMAAIGFPNLDMEDLVKARIFKIDASFARQIADMGFKNDSLEGLVKFRIFKVTPEFLNEVQAEGLRDLSAEDVVKLRIFKIDGEFIRQARAENVPVNVEDLVQKRIGVWRK